MIQPPSRVPFAAGMAVLCSGRVRRDRFESVTASA